MGQNLTSVKSLTNFKIKTKFITIGFKCELFFDQHFMKNALPFSKFAKMPTLLRKSTCIYYMQSSVSVQLHKIQLCQYSVANIFIFRRNISRIPRQILPNSAVIPMQLLCYSIVLNSLLKKIHWYITRLPWHDEIYGFLKEFVCSQRQTYLRRLH